MRVTALLLDTYSLFFRAYHALPKMNTADGMPTNALYGFAVLLLKMLREHTPAGTAFALDLPGTTERKRVYPEYKGNRGPVPSDLVAQLGLLQQLIEASGFPAFGVGGFEADDVLATLARKLGERGDAVLIASGDRDSLQLVRERTHVLFLGRRGAPPQRYDRAAVLARFGVTPEQLPSYVALVGDPSDNLPKIPAIGPRTAQSLIASCGDAAGLLAHAADLPNPKLRATLLAHAETLLRNESLARLRDDLDLGAGPWTAPLTGAAIERVAALLERLECTSLLPRLQALRAPDSARA